MYIPSGSLRQDLLSGAFFCFAMAALLLWKWHDEQRLERRLDAEGTAVGGVVVDRGAHQRDDGSTYWKLKARYAPMAEHSGAKEKLLTLEQLVLEEVYDRYRIGDSIEVVYLPGAPHEGRLPGKPPPYESLPLIAGFCGLLGIVFLFWGLRLSRSPERS